MPTELDLELVPAVYDLIQELGFTATFTVSSSTTYDHTTGSVSETLVTHDRKISPPQDDVWRYVNQDIVQMGDAIVYVAAKDLDFTPDNGMQISWDGEEWRIVSVLRLRSGEQMAAYGCHIRR